MKFVDLHDPKRVEREPDQVKILFSNGIFSEQGIRVNRAELRLYLEKTDESLGPYSLITSLVETDIGSIEMLYDEGYRGDNSLDRVVAFLTEHLGISALILRSVIALKENYQKRK